MNANPLAIDVVIPVYNGERYIARALESVAAQTLPPRSIIVVNDGSTDKTREAARGVNLRGIPLDWVDCPHRGEGATRNQGIRRSHAPWIAFLDADDEWLPEKLQAQSEVVTATRFSDLGLVYCSHAWIDERGRMLSPTPNLPPVLRGRVFDQLLRGNQVVSSASGALVRKQCFDQVGAFDESLRIGADWDMWLRISEKFDLDYSERVLVRLRKHTQSAQADPARLYQGMLSFIDHWATRVPERAVPDEWREAAVRLPLGEPKRAQLLLNVPDLLSPPARRALYANYLGSWHGFLAWRGLMEVFSIVERTTRQVAREISAAVSALVTAIRFLVSGDGR